MNPPHGKGPRGTLNPWVCAGINQLAWPGLGTILAGRGLGFAQAGLMLIGFVLFLGFILIYFQSMWAWASDPRGTEEQLHSGYRPYIWLGVVGLGCSAFAWGWALMSSLALVRSAPRPPPILERSSRQH